VVVDPLAVGVVNDHLSRSRTFNCIHMRSCLSAVISASYVCIVGEEHAGRENMRWGLFYYMNFNKHKRFNKNTFNPKKLDITCNLFSKNAPLGEGEGTRNSLPLPAINATPRIIQNTESVRHQHHLERTLVVCTGRLLIGLTAPRLGFKL